MTYQKWAENGYRLFKATWKNHQWIGKTRYRSEDPSQRATNDIPTLKRWHKQWPDAAWCIDLVASGIAVVDEDNKHGKTGSSIMTRLEIEHDFLPDTLTVTTPSGGIHRYYTGSPARGANKLGTGIDLPGIVPMPGQDIPGKGPYKIVEEHPIPELPEWIYDLAGRNGNGHEPGKAENPPKPIIELDQQHNIDRATDYLINDATPAIEGHGGDQTTLITAMTIKDMGISAIKCLELMDTHYNPRCNPPWDIEDLETKIDNAYKYGRTPPGARSPDAQFGIIQPETKRIKIKPMRDVTNHMDPLKWWIDGYIEKGSIVEMFGASDSYKSFLAISMCCAIASGQDWYGRTTEKGKILYLAGEGQRNLKKRFVAWGREHDIDIDTLDIDITERPLQITDARYAKELKIIADYNQYALIVIDTLARHFGPGDENSANDMGRFIAHLDTAIGGDTAKLLLHHTGHKELGRGRGSSALKGAMDTELMVEAKTKHVEMRCVKMKDAPKGGEMYFRPREVVLAITGDAAITSMVLDKIGEEEIDDIDEDEVLDMLVDGVPQKEIAKGLGVRNTKISDIVRGAIAEKKLKKTGTKKNAVYSRC